jgi:hypothetical protein
VLATGGISVAGAAVTLTLVQEQRALGGIFVAGELISMRVNDVRTARQANALIQVAGRYAHVNPLDAPLIPTDEIGWIQPDADTPDIQAMVFKINGKKIKGGRLATCEITLTDRGGYQTASMTISLRTTKEYNPPWHAPLLITYKGSQIFRGRLEETAMESGDDVGRRLVFTGPLIRLEDHEAFRRVYVDQNLDNWETGQGAQTASTVWEVQSL